MHPIIPDAYHGNHAQACCLDPVVGHNERRPIIKTGGRLDQESLREQWEFEERQPFTGWNFSYLDGRMFEDETPWSYIDRAGALMDAASSAIDLDTGGGERLLDMRAHWPARMVATEGYPPNRRLAFQRLSPLGVGVLDAHMTDYDPLPFADATFDLVLNRHAAFNCDEVARVLQSRGCFLTQQVHGMYAWDLLAAFDAHPQWPEATPEKYVPRLRAAGLVITDVQEFKGRLRFMDVGALVYYLKAVPWMVPDFSVATHEPHLRRLQARLETEGELRFISWKYLIEAHKP
jgi:SAM-dependent methyltransferase